MPELYRLLLRLYPAAYRDEFGEEMVTVFLEARTEAQTAKPALRAAFRVREIMGLLRGAMLERFRFLFDSNLPASRRFSMRSGFRFPKSATALMFLILALVIVAIEKAKSVAGALPHTHPQLPPMHPAPLSSPVAFALTFLAVWAVAIGTWAVLFVLRRSGMHRLSALNAAPAGK